MDTISRRGFLKGIAAGAAFSFTTMGTQTKVWGAEADGIRAADLRCEYLRNPIGIASRRPRLSWVVSSPSSGALQTAYRIRVATSESGLDGPDLWDSGKVYSDRSTHIGYAGRELESGLRCFWTVQLWDESERSGSIATPGWWEMALLDEEDWKGRWIAGPDPCPLFRRAFDLARPVSSARLYISGQGVYEAWINGRPVSDEVLGPQLSNYPVRMFYDTFDLAPLLREGTNVIGVRVAPGWFGSERTTEPIPMPKGPRHALIAQLAFVHGDGRRDIIGTDDTWRTTLSGIEPVKSHWTHCFAETGERFDATREASRWQRAGFDDKHWDRARAIEPPTKTLWARINEPNRIAEVLEPVSIGPVREPVDLAQFVAMAKASGSRNWSRETMEHRVFAEHWLREFERSYQEHGGAPLGGFEVDFGKHVSGWVRMDATGEAGDVVTMFGLDQHRLRGGSPEEVGQRFIHRAFRYVPVYFSGKTRPPRIENIRAQSVQNDVRPVGRFACSVPVLNRIHDAAARTWRSHMLSGMPRDSWRERFGTGLIENCESAFYWSDMGAFYTKWLQDLRDSQRPDGYLTMSGGPIAYDYWSPNWSKNGIVLVPWLMYLHYGDQHAVAENYPVMKRWLALCIPRDEAGRTWQPPEDHGVAEAGFGDHGRPTARWYDSHTGDLFETLHMIHCFRMAEQMARLLGEDTDAERYALVQAQFIEKVNRAEFLDHQRGVYGEGDQGCHALAICEQTAPKSLREQVAQFLIDDIMTHQKGHQNTGFLGTWYLLKALTALNRPDVAAALLSNETPPSLATMLRHPDSPEELTMLPEFFTGGMIPHPGWCSVGFWFYQSLGGIHADWTQPGFKRVLIKPQIAAGIEWAKVEHDSIAGTIGVEWTQSDGRIHLKVTVPPNTSAHVHIPTPDRGKVKAPKEDMFLKIEGECAVFEVHGGAWPFAWNQH
ncbi:MAG: alpha-L-rhamnosidase N-terminal domain-containing protein [Candidatus Hydrogenedentes bacterium]|nr:alpha-L-rhamnosidase N-terminal domain-containing protein [Candidatus Hydrogenedentota bacterium]